MTGRSTLRRYIVCAAIAAVLLCAITIPAAAQEKPKGAVFAVLIGGQPGAPVYARRYADWLKRMHAYLLKAGVPAENIVVISGDDAMKDPIVSAKASIDSITKALAAMSGRVKAEDQFILFMVGHGTLTDPVPLLTIPGADISVQQIADATRPIAAENQLFLLFNQGAGEMVKPLIKPKRVIFAATKATEPTDPIMAEFFLRGLESKRADGEGAPDAGTKDGTVTVLEAYNWAAYQTALWTCRQQGLKQEATWVVTGKESVEIFKKLYAGPEGEEGTRQLDSTSDANAADAVVELAPKDSDTVADYWDGRRIVSEHAVLEDCGQDEPISCLRPKGLYEPLAGFRDTESGHLARRVVIGQAALLPAPPIPASKATTKPANNAKK